MTIHEFISQKPYLVWSTDNYDTLSEAAIVEAVLNYADFDDIKKMFAIIGIKRAADIFRKQLLKKRNNYRPEIAHYFTLYFRRYA